MNGVALLLPLLAITPAVAHASVLTPFSDKDWRYNAGFEQGFLAIPFKGHHTGNFTIGYIKGTSTFRDNRNSNPGHDTEWYIGFHNGAIEADNEYDNGNIEYKGCPSGHSQNYCSGYEKGWQVDADVLG